MNRMVGGAELVAARLARLKLEKQIADLAGTGTCEGACPDLEFGFRIWNDYLRAPTSAAKLAFGLWVPRIYRRHLAAFEHFGWRDIDIVWSARFHRSRGIKLDASHPGLYWLASEVCRCDPRIVLRVLRRAVWAQLLHVTYELVPGDHDGGLILGPPLDTFPLPDRLGPYGRAAALFPDYEADPIWSGGPAMGSTIKRKGWEFSDADGVPIWRPPSEPTNDPDDRHWMLKWMDNEGYDEDGNDVPLPPGRFSTPRKGR